jgi:hypothetical protein
MVVNVAVPPGMRFFVCGVATGSAGKATVGVIVAFASCPVLSCTTYFTGDATPEKVGNGSNVTVPFAFTVYVPWFATVNVVKSQLAFVVEVVAHSFTVLATKIAGDVAVSFVNIEIT